MKAQVIGLAVSSFFGVGVGVGRLGGCVCVVCEGVRQGMSPYNPFVSTESVYGVHSGLRVNPFLEQHQRAKVHADESRNGTSSHRSEGSAVASSRPTRSAVERPLTIYDRPYPHADIVYRLVDLLLEKYSTNIVCASTARSSPENS